MANDILLEAGTNEMELLVFRINHTPFGINVAKVREIIQKVPTIPVPNAGYAIDGLFKIRDEVRTLINLARHFEMEHEYTGDDEKEQSIIVVEFNEICCGILVDEVEVIHRLSWNKISPPSPYLQKIGAPITGTVMVNERTVLIVDFEALVGEILGAENATPPEKLDESEISFKDARVLIADDSSVLREALTRILHHKGVSNISICSDGKQAWDLLEKHKGVENGPYDLILTDIEMPQMDGLHLTRRIKEDPQLQEIPVVLFSSLITKDNLNKGKQVGADAQVAKPDSEGMIRAIDELLEKRIASLNNLNAENRAEGVSADN
ncbi:MAG: response regulator [candidate division Zixibacteria bacterium]|nr:response regulator [candidate division Zixibacteria bacterium]